MAHELILIACILIICALTVSLGLVLLALYRVIEDRAGSLTRVVRLAKAIKRSAPGSVERYARVELLIKAIEEQGW